MFYKLTTPGLDDLYSINATPFSIVAVTGISDQADNRVSDFIISPNPADNELIIESLKPTEWVDIQQLEVFSAKGEVVMTQSIESINPLGQAIRLNVNELQQGVYVLKMISKMDIHP